MLHHDLKGFLAGALTKFLQERDVSAEDGLEAGADDYLSKPVDLRQLTGLMNRLLQER